MQKKFDSHYLINNVLDEWDYESIPLDPEENEWIFAIYHDGCIKINDALAEEKRFKPECLVIDKDGYNNSLVFIYACENQGIFEVGEVNHKLLKNNEPYKTALNLCFDRVVLHNSGLIHQRFISDSGLIVQGFITYSELMYQGSIISEDLKSLKKNLDEGLQDQQPPDEGIDYISEFINICGKYGLNKSNYETAYGLNDRSTNEDYFNACNALKKEIED